MALRISAWNFCSFHQMVGHVVDKTCVHRVDASRRFRSLGCVIAGQVNRVTVSLDVRLKSVQNLVQRWSRLFWLVLTLQPSCNLGPCTNLFS